MAGKLDCFMYLYTTSIFRQVSSNATNTIDDIARILFDKCLGVSSGFWGLRLSIAKWCILPLARITQASVSSCATPPRNASLLSVPTEINVYPSELARGEGLRRSS